MRVTLTDIFNRLSDHFGPMHWWPADSRFEVMVGAILTQNTSWKNVEKAIANLKRQDLMSPSAIYRLDTDKLSEVIKPAGYFRVKAKRLANFLNYFIERYGGDVEEMGKMEMGRLRCQLLKINGIGPETADSILLYALDKPVFVVDAYTQRILGRVGITNGKADYDQIQQLFHSALSRDAQLFNEYHALLVKLGNTTCKSVPICSKCPIQERCRFGSSSNQTVDSRTDILSG